MYNTPSFSALLNFDWKVMKHLFLTVSCEQQNDTINNPVFDNSTFVYLPGRLFRHNLLWFYVSKFKYLITCIVFQIFKKWPCIPENALVPFNYRRIIETQISIWQFNIFNQILCCALQYWMIGQSVCFCFRSNCCFSKPSLLEFTAHIVDGCDAWWSPDCLLLAGLYRRLERNSGQLSDSSVESLKLHSEDVKYVEPTSV